MAKTHIKHIRHHARKHEEAHSRLKDLLGRVLFTEKVWDIFAGTFVLTISSIIIFMNWGNITGFFTGTEPETERAQEEKITEENMKAIHGFKSGVLATYQINGQTADQYIRYIRQIPGGGHRIGIQTSGIIGKEEEKQAEIRQNTLIAGIMLSTEISKGYHLTSVRKAGSLQKSVLATYYLGEKTISIDSTLQTDAALLGKINNALSVDVFAYLNQSDSRADALDNYLSLLETMNSKASARSQDLTSVINFLTANFQSQEVSIGASEAAFFENLKIFDGENAEEELGYFIGLQQEQTEVKAKIGAYKGLKSYYDFFIPKLDNLIRAIKANRDPLIAGVKVVEIQNMTLPLIIRER